MEYRKAGGTDLWLSAFGFGGGRIGSEHITDYQAGQVLTDAFEKGINYFDTAISYGLSEERFGKFLSGFRDRVIISTKGGYGIDGAEDWTYDAVILSAEASLRKLRRNYIDIFFLHSCSSELLGREDIYSALEKLKHQGKIRYSGYSGDNQALAYAADTGSFDIFMGSLNICDQKVIESVIPQIIRNGKGFIAKRSTANYFWKYGGASPGDYHQEYRRRWEIMKDFTGVSPEKTAARFTFFTPGVTSGLVGISKSENLEANLSQFLNGPLDQGTYKNICDGFYQAGKGNWESEI